jgi:hypothetical protein
VKREEKRRAVVLPRFAPNTAIMPLNNFLAGGETKSRAFIFACVANSFEWLKYAPVVLLGNPNSIVFY